MLDIGLGLSLRRITEDDLEQLFLWRNDPKVYNWSRQTGPLHWMGHTSWYKSQAMDPKISMFAVQIPEALGGVVGLTDIDLVNRRAEFSCYISPGLHKRGIATNALKTLFTHGFNDLGLHKIWGETFDGNPALDLFTKKLGMTVEGTRKEHQLVRGRLTDTHLIGINRDAFEKYLQEPEYYYDEGGNRIKKGEISIEFT